MSNIVTVEKLYELCEIIDNSKNKNQCQNEFSSILAGIKSGANEKRLAAQLIARYFHHFPELREQALDAMFELCEDDDVNIRKLVIKDLPTLCREKGLHINKIADVLVQLLQTEDSHEQQIVHSALYSLLTTHSKDTLQTLFGHILNVEEDLIRERAIKFLAVKLKQLPETVVTKPIEEFILQESKKVLQDVSGDEFLLFMHILSNLKHLQTVAGRQLLLDIVVDQADLDKSFSADDPDRIDQIIHCMKQAIPFLSKNVPSTKFVVYMVDKVLPVLDSIRTDNESACLELIRLTADLVQYCGDLDDLKTKLDVIFNRLMEILPVPPSESDDGTENDKDTNVEEPKIQFSEVECLIWILHQLARKSSDYFSGAENFAKTKEFRRRLQYLARVIQVYSKKLRQILSTKSKEELKDETNRIKVIALRTTSNINTIVKDLLHIPPIYKAIVVPSWKSSEKPAHPPASDNPAKRSLNGNDGASSQPKMARKEIAVYQPPSGKYSEKAGNFQTPAARGGSWRGGRGGGRGRGFRKNWY